MRRRRFSVIVRSRDVLPVDNELEAASHVKETQPYRSTKLSTVGPRRFSGWLESAAGTDFPTQALRLD